MVGRPVSDLLCRIVGRLVGLSFIQPFGSLFLMFVGHLCGCVFRLVGWSPGLVICLVGLSLVWSFIWWVGSSVFGMVGWLLGSNLEEMMTAQPWLISHKETL